MIIDDSHLLIGLTQRKSKLFCIVMNESPFTTWSKAPTEVEPLLPETLPGMCYLP